MKRRLLLSSALAGLAIASLSSLSGCASQQVDAYAAEKPVLDLQQYFNGTLDA